jgi:hypothetical protein
MSVQLYWTTLHISNFEFKAFYSLIYIYIICNTYFVIPLLLRFYIYIILKFIFKFMEYVVLKMTEFHIEQSYNYLYIFRYGERLSSSYPNIIYTTKYVII